MSSAAAALGVRPPPSALGALPPLSLDRAHAAARLAFADLSTVVGAEEAACIAVPPAPTVLPVTPPPLRPIAGAIAVTTVERPAYLEWLGMWGQCWALRLAERLARSVELLAIAAESPTLHPRHR